MDASRFDGLQGFDGASELAFQGPLIGDLLGKLAGPELWFIQKLESYVAASGEALLGQFQAQCVDLVGRHQDRAAVVRESVRDVALAQDIDDGATVAAFDIRKESAVVRLAHPEREDDENRHSRCRQSQEHWLGQEREARQGRIPAEPVRREAH